MDPGGRLNNNNTTYSSREYARSILVLASTTSRTLLIPSVKSVNRFDCIMSTFFPVRGNSGIGIVNIAGPAAPMAHSEDQQEALQRTLDEIEALQVIFACHDEDGEDAYPCHFFVASEVELQTAREIADLGACEMPPCLEVVVKVRLYLEIEDGEDCVAPSSLRCRLPPGYPGVPASVVASIEGMKRSVRDELSKTLNIRAFELTGEAMIMQLVNFFREIAPEFWKRERAAYVATEAEKEIKNEMSNHRGWSRRWIWVHHITNTDRCKSIVEVARELDLGGYLKPGYPGVVIVEGPSNDCDDFVIFIKGNKSRPGGFGRNWGHHVRGHVDLPKGLEGSLLPSKFVQLEGDMAELGELCGGGVLKDEFMEFIMQHKSSS